MSRYIGKQPVSGNFVKLDAITTSATATYALQSGGSAFTPQSVNQMIVSLNGVIQAPTSAFTLSGSNIVFDSALTSSDVIDFILVLGDVNDIGTPSDNTVATTKIVNNAVTADKLASTLDLSSKTLTIPDNNITKAKTNFISTGTDYTGTGLDIKGDGSSNGRLGLLCSAGTHGVAIESPDHSAGQSYTIKLPDNQIAVDKMIKIKSISGSGNTAIGQAEFVDAPSGSHTLLSTSTVSSPVSSVDITSNIDATYKRYMIDIINLVPSSDAVHLYLRLNDGSSFKSNAGYGYTAIFHGSDDGSSTFGNRRKDSAASQVELANEVGSSTDESLHGRVFLYDPYQASVDYRGSYYMVSSRGDNVTEMMGVFRYDRHQLSVGNEPCSGVQFFMQSGNIASCVIKLYGIS